MNSMELQPAVTADCGEELETLFNWLDAVRASGAINMFGAATELQRGFDMNSAALARKVLAAWMVTFEERHAAKDAIA